MEEPPVLKSIFLDAHEDLGQVWTRITLLKPRPGVCVVDWQAHGYYKLAPLSDRVKTHVLHVHGEQAHLGFDLDSQRTQYQIIDNDKEMEAVLKFGAMSQPLVQCFPHKGQDFPSARANERFTRIMQQHINHVEVGGPPDGSLGVAHNAAGASPSTVASLESPLSHVQTPRAPVAPPSIASIVPRNLFGNNVSVPPPVQHPSTDVAPGSAEGGTDEA
eukprot:1231768-Amphidinium_carterae.2